MLSPTGSSYESWEACSSLNLVDLAGERTELVCSVQPITTYFQSGESDRVFSTACPICVNHLGFYSVNFTGSERVSHTGATGVRLQEAGNINRSLAALSDVIKVNYPPQPEEKWSASKISKRRCVGQPFVAKPKLLQREVPNFGEQEGKNCFRLGRAGGKIESTADTDTVFTPACS